MRKILITGNGFDLFHHLPTKYGHFMVIMKTIEKYDFSKNMTFEHLFGIYFKDEFLADYENIKKNYKTEEILFDRTRIREVAEMLKNNNWYNYFKSATEIVTWIDFENEINIALSEVLEILNPDEFIFDNIFSLSQKHSLLSHFRIFDELKPTDQGINMNYSYLVKSKNGLKIESKINDKKLFEELSTSLDEFKVIFNRYFIDLVNPFYEKIKSIPKINFSKINNIYTFNYTSTISEFYNIDKSKVVSLHGKADILDTEHNIILGVNEISNMLKKHKLYDFTKYYQKIEEKSKHSFIKIQYKKLQRGYGTNFYIIGHSLDNSDKEYILHLFKFLENDLNGESKICVFYYNKNDKNNKLKNLFNVVGDESKVVNTYNEGRLYFVKLNEENINDEFNK